MFFIIERWCGGYYFHTKNKYTILIFDLWIFTEKEIYKMVCQK